MIEFNAPIIIEFWRDGSTYAVAPGGQRERESVGAKDAKTASLIAMALEAQGYRVQAREYIRAGHGLSGVAGWTAPSDGYYPSKMLA